VLVDVSTEVLHRQLEAVEHRQQLLEEILVGALDERRLLAQHALAVVLEVSLEATGQVEQVVALVLQRGNVDRDLHLFLRLLWCRATRVRCRTRFRGLLFTHYALCWSSSTTSASATSSSDGCCDASLAPPAAVCCCACACWYSRLVNSLLAVSNC